MAGFDSADESYNDFALPPEVEVVSVPAPLTFAPWHKPRKQFVRKNQWMRHATQTIENLISSGKLSESGTVSYLTLPGPDMLDVRMMAEVCKAQNVMLKYTGFCSVGEDETIRLRRNTTQFQLDLEGVIQQESKVHPSRLEEVAVTGSTARTMMERGGPYMIVNIDACEPLVNRDIAQTARLIDAIREIIKFQLANTRQPWLLFLTTPVQTEWVDDRSLGILKGEVVSNAHKDKEFSAKLAEQFATGEDINAYLLRACSENGHQLCSIFSLGIAKWILHLSEQAHYKMIKKLSFCYSMLKRRPTFPNMISTCYYFSPLPLDLFDTTGLTKDGPQEEGTTKAKSAHMHALEKSMMLIDLDNMLTERPQIESEMISQSKAYLAQVGYNVDDPQLGYDAWLKSEAVT